MQFKFMRNVFCMVIRFYPFGFIIVLLNSLRLQEGLSRMDVKRIEYRSFN